MPLPNPGFGYCNSPGNPFLTVNPDFLLVGCSSYPCCSNTHSNYISVPWNCWQVLCNTKKYFSGLIVPELKSPIPTIKHQRSLFLKATLMLCLLVVQGNFSAPTRPSNTTTHHETNRKAYLEQYNNSRGFKNYIIELKHPTPTIRRWIVVILISCRERSEW